MTKEKIWINISRVLIGLAIVGGIVAFIPLEIRNQFLPYAAIGTQQKSVTSKALRSILENYPFYGNSDRDHHDIQLTVADTPSGIVFFSEQGVCKTDELPLPYVAVNLLTKTYLIQTTGPGCGISDGGVIVHNGSGQHLGRCFSFGRRASWCKQLEQSKESALRAHQEEIDQVLLELGYTSNGERGINIILE